MATLATKGIAVVEERFESTAGDASAATPDSGTFWIFDDARSSLPYWCHMSSAGGAACLLHATTGISWILSFALAGLLAALLWHPLVFLWARLGAALRHRLAISSVSLARTLARSDALLVAYHRRSGGEVTFAPVMNFRSMLETSPDTLHARILQVVESLESQRIRNA
jgi:hypothetical protein